MSFGRLLLVVLLAAASVVPVRAQSRPIYIQFDPYTVKGALYRPDSGDEPAVGVLVIHRVNNYLGHLAARELARRGFLVLVMNSRFDNNEAAVVWEQIALDVKTGVEFLLEGATHNIDPCVECETRKGEYGNSARNFFNYVRDWMNARFAR